MCLWPGLQRRRLGSLLVFFFYLLGSHLSWKCFSEMEKIPQLTLSAVLMPAAVLWGVFTPSGLMSCQRKGWEGQRGNLAMPMLLFSPWKCPPAICRCRVVAGLSPALRWKVDPSDRCWDSQQRHSLPGDLHTGSSPEDAAATCPTPLAGSVPEPLLSWHPAVLGCPRVPPSALSSLKGLQNQTCKFHLAFFFLPLMQIHAICV